jgi:hypothetical protein
MLDEMEIIWKLSRTSIHRMGFSLAYVIAHAKKGNSRLQYDVNCS